MLAVDRFPRVRAPFLTRAEMAEVDRLMVEEYGIGVTRMMENAGRHLAHLARVLFLGGNPVGRSVAVVAGTGGNGGGALACARRLAGWGARVSVVLGRGRPRPGTAAAEQLAILERLHISVASAWPAGNEGVDLVIDGLVGYGLAGPLDDRAAMLVEAVNGTAAPVLALDLPSGLDANRGPAGPALVRADATLTLALPKVGLADAGSRPFVGRVFLADIGIPPAVYAAPSVGRSVGPIFAISDIVRVEGLP